MSKHNILTQEELYNFQINPEIILELENIEKKLLASKNQINILDFGCGRGRTIAKLYELGYTNIYGVDNDLNTLNNGRIYFNKYFSNPSERLQQIINNKTNFEDNFFHFVFSEQVFEHVADIKTAITEINRLTKKNGKGYHTFPAPFKTIIEEHVKIPFVHWIPKCFLRYFVIFISVLFKKDAFWEQIQGKSIFFKTKTYYNYLKNKTFYRKWQVYDKLFKSVGFSVNFKKPINKNNLLFKILWRLNKKYYYSLQLNSTNIILKTTKN